MDAPTTSGAATRPWFVPPMWAELADFVRRPLLPGERQKFGARAVGEVAQLLALNVAISFALVVVLGWLATQWGVTPPNLEKLGGWGAGTMFLLGALVIPVLEEWLFRGWLTGGRRGLAALALAVAAGIAMFVAWLTAGPEPQLAMGIVLLVVLLIAPLLLWKVGGGQAHWVPAAFPRLYYLSALLFGLAHLSNYELSRPWLLLPFVLPQTIAGLIFGFARVRYGMWANIALHALSNALFIGLAAAGL